MIHNEPRTPLPCQISPHPLNKDAHSKAGCGEKLKMNRRPGKPRNESTQVKLPALQNGKTLADNCHAALVEITKGSRSCRSGDARMNQLARIAPLLNCHLRHTGQLLAVLIERRGIADDENLGMAGHRQVLLYPYPAGMICLHA